jgi:hypothetical protein
MAENQPSDESSEPFNHFKPVFQQIAHTTELQVSKTRNFLPNYLGRIGNR